MERLSNWIGGAHVAPSEPAYQIKIDPSRDEVAYEVPLSGEIDVVGAVRAAHQGRKSLGASEARLAVLEPALARLRDEADAWTELVARETGRPVGGLRREWDEVLRAARADTRRLAAEDQGLAGRRDQAVGVVAIILSWRDPLSSLVARVFPALAAGNAVVVKPSMLAPRAAVRLGELLGELGLPVGAYNVVHGAAEPVGRFLAQHPGVARVAFAGSSARGAKLLAEVAAQLKGIHLELSRKNTIIVLKDADVTKITPRLARAAVDGYPKILVQDELYPALRDALTTEIGGLRVGAAHDPATEVGPLISPKHRDEFRAAVETARREDGRFLVGGGVDYGPVLVGELTNCSEIHQTDLAGPLVTLNTFKYVTDAVKWANNTPFGGVVSVWTKNLVAAQKLTAELDFGSIVVNGWGGGEAARGGLKASGLGDFDGLFRVQKIISIN